MKTFARKCSNCKEGMNSGFVINGGEEYYCSSPCLHTHYTPSEWEDMYDDGETDSYYTEWDESDHEYRQHGNALRRLEKSIQ